MARLPEVGGDSGNWGSVLNEYLTQSLNSDGSLKSSAINPILVQGSGVILTHNPGNNTISVAATSTGADGRSVELQNNGANLQWRLVGDTTWNNLVALTAITGPQGAQGATGATGPQGPAGAQGPQGDPQTVISQAEAQAGVATTARAVSAASLNRDVNYYISQKFVVLEANDPAGSTPGVIYFRKAV